MTKLATLETRFAELEQKHKSALEAPPRANKDETSHVEKVVGTMVRGV